MTSTRELTPNAHRHVESETIGTEQQRLPIDEDSTSLINQLKTRDGLKTRVAVKNTGEALLSMKKLNGKYRPLPSLWEGEDSALLERMLEFYPRKRPKKILDATINTGRFWRESARKIIGLDISQRYRPTIVADNMRIPLVSASLDVIIYDPPHVPNQGKDREKDFTERFGRGLKSSRANGYNFSHLYAAFASEAYRVLKREGVLFCKISDYVHNHRLQWAHLEMVRAAAEVGFQPCDCIVKARKGPIVDPKWKTAHHARRHHCYWLVFRKSAKCE